MFGTESLGVKVSTQGLVARSDKAYAKDKVAHLFRIAGRPILYASVRLVEARDPACDRRSIVEATIDVDGRLVRAHVAASTMREAVDLLEARLRRRLLMLAERAESKRLRHRGDVSTEWRHGDPPRYRPSHFDRPPDEREIVRRKTFALDTCTPDEAAFEMELLAHDFYLFTDLDSGADSVIFRRSSGRYGLTQPPEVATDCSGCAAPIEASERVPASLGAEQAAAMLDLSDERFVFFLDDGTGRGCVLYRRYDGHYGLITSAT